MIKYDLKMQVNMLNPVKFAESDNRDTMYYHQEIKGGDTNGFCKDIVKEVNVHINFKYW